MKILSLGFVIMALALAGACSRSDTRVLTHKLSDAEITTSVKAKLATDEGLRTLADVHVSTSSGVVTLSGDVPDTHKRARVAELAASVDGVVKVNNGLEIRTAANPEPEESRSRQAPLKPRR